MTSSDEAHTRLHSRRGLKRPLLVLLTAAIAAVTISACGTQSIQLSRSNPDYVGAKIFLDHCSGCHSLALVGADGSATSVQDRVKTNAPDFNYRKETVQQVLYALRNGGFSGQVMPENIVVGKQAQEVAEFLAKYSGLKAEKEAAPTGK